MMVGGQARPVSKLSNARSWENSPGWVAGGGRFFTQGCLQHPSWLVAPLEEGLSSCDRGGTVDGKGWMGIGGLWQIPSPPPPITLEGGPEKGSEGF